MPNQPMQKRFRFPVDFVTWWSMGYDVPDHSIDEFEHMTATHYPEVFELASESFVHHLMGHALDYVVAELTVIYRHEIVADQSPVRVYAAMSSVGVSSFSMRSVIVDAGGNACAQADIRYVAWDRESRGKRSLTERERAAFEPVLIR